MLKKQFFMVMAFLGMMLLTSNFAYAKVVNIGALIPMTGQGAAYGVIFQQSINLAINDVNKSLRPENIKLVVHYMDHQASTSVGVSGFYTLERLYHCPVILSSYSNVSMAVGSLGNRYKVLVINAGGQGNMLGGSYPYLINTIPLVGEETKALAKYLVQNKHFKTAAILYDSNEGGESAKDSFKKFFEQYGGKIVITEGAKLGSTNFRSQLINIRSKRPDVIYLATYGDDTSVIATQAKELKIEIPLVENSWSLIPPVLKNPNSNGMIVTYVALKASPEFLKEYKQLYGSEPESIYPIAFYNAVQVVAQSLKYIISKGWKIEGESFLKAVHAIKTFKSPASGNFTIRENGTVATPVGIGVIENGTVKPIMIVTNK